MFTKEEKDKARYFKFSFHPLNELEHYLQPRFLPVIEQNPDLDVIENHSITIPKHIILFWHEATPPKDVQDSIDKIRLHNPTYQVLLFDEQSAGQFIQQNYGQEFYYLYARRCVHPSMKSDFFRMCYLAQKGGIYVDIDIDCVKSLEEIFKNYAFDCLLFYSRGQPCCIDNDFIVCQPNNPIIAAVLKKICDNLTGEYSFSSVWECTGPGAVSMAVMEILMQGIIDDAMDHVGLNRLQLIEHHLMTKAYYHMELEYKKSQEGNWRYFKLPTRLNVL
ncbi:glycosyltransferase family 32 protein [Commensalibacter nepenthis]|uniref:Glycosyltransferase n=1 Tax=Commensalibacter nepenthis TaxID=3043872 RepID=A0ABT6Q8R6_9PROT|nr:glycosyltransferase [Commensalibacter sp. TBRC 10068]MDI2113137.1 glycosyltransferase [Commensalibacter sp. TBRC 10068]